MCIQVCTYKYVVLSYIEPIEPIKVQIIGFIWRNTCAPENNNLTNMLSKIESQQYNAGNNNNNGGSNSNESVVCFWHSRNHSAYIFMPINIFYCNEGEHEEKFVSLLIFRCTFIHTQFANSTLGGGFSPIIDNGCCIWLRPCCRYFYSDRLVLDSSDSFVVSLPFGWDK